MTDEKSHLPRNPEPDWADEIDKFLTGTVTFLLRFARTCWLFVVCPWRAPRHVDSERNSLVRPYPYLFVSALLISGAAVLSLQGGWSEPDRVVAFAYDAAAYFNAERMAIAVALAIVQVIVALAVGWLLVWLRLPLSRSEAVRWVSYTMGTQWLTLGMFFVLRRIIGPGIVLVEDVIEVLIFVQPAWILWWILPGAKVTRMVLRQRLALIGVAALLTAATIGGNAVPQLVDSVKRPLRLSVAGFKLESLDQDHVVRMDAAVTNTSSDVMFLQYRASLIVWPDAGLALPLSWDIPADAPPEVVLEPGDTYHLQNARVRIPRQQFDHRLQAVRWVSLTFQNRSHGVATQWAFPDWNTPSEHARSWESLGGRRIGP